MKSERNLLFAELRSLQILVGRSEYFAGVPQSSQRDGSAPSRHNLIDM